MLVNVENNQSIDLSKLPLIEVDFVVAFAEINDFSSVHFGLYWNTIKERFPSSFDREPIFDREDNDLPPLRRVAFVDENDQKIIQLQCNCFVFNYRLNKAVDFNAIFEDFLQEWNFFVDWIFQEFKCKIELQKYQLHFLNILDNDYGWVNLKESTSVFNFFNEIWLKQLTDLVDFKCQFIYTIPDNQGLITINIEKHLQVIDSDLEDENSQESEVAFLSLTAISNDINNLDKSQTEKEFALWYTLAYNCIIDRFLELTKYSIAINSGELP